MNKYLVKKLNKKLNTTISVPGDKSITHRAIILGSLAEGETIINNYLDSDDCRRTINAFRQMGVKLEKINNKIYIESKGLNNLITPENVIDAGNSGTTMRLLCGVIAGQNFYSEIIGDESLSKRPMRRVIDPLRKMGAEISAVNDMYPPIKIRGNTNLNPITYELPVPSAQVKSAIILASLQAVGTTVIKEPIKTRDHTELMLKHFGVEIINTYSTITINGKTRFKGKTVYVPGDFSSAAFFIVLGLILSDAKIKIENVGLNPTRTGLLDCLKKMGANITIEGTRLVNNEIVGNIIVESSKLNSIDITEPQDITNMIDEIPILCLAATQANGTTTIRNAKELRVKESDRIRTISTELNKMGAKIIELEDGFIIEGGTKLKGANVDSYNDHRIAMTLAISGLCAEGETVINNSNCVSISFPEFFTIIEDFSK
jgi:3-phosphoshikimate 1-carboxyvinyltransferase